MDADRPGHRRLRRFPVRRRLPRRDRPAPDHLRRHRHLQVPARPGADQGRDRSTRAQAAVPQNSVSWVVELEFNSQGATDFENVTGAAGHPDHAAEPVRHRAGRHRDLRSQRVSGRSPAAAPRSAAASPRRPRHDLANVLKYGALPLSFDVSSVDNVSAKLGGEQLQAGIIAGLIGLGLVVAYSVLYYRGLALVVVASLVVAGALTWALDGAARPEPGLRPEPAGHRRRDRRHRRHRRLVHHLLRTDPRRGARGPQPAHRHRDRLDPLPEDHPGRRLGVAAVGRWCCSSWPSAR